jgi:hypothetical protein
MLAVPLKQVIQAIYLLLLQQLQKFKMPDILAQPIIKKKFKATVYHRKIKV